MVEPWKLTRQREESDTTMNKISFQPFEFQGKAGEYFRIWIVNVCLTIISVGLYSPWAKIRQKRYFYGSTHLAGATFDYVANPWAILKGRLIAVALVIVFGTIIHFLPGAERIFWLAFIIALPWLTIRTLRFNAVNTVYRNIRFNFTGAYKQAFVYFALGPFFLVPLSLGLAQPWSKRGQMTLIVDNSFYGKTAFNLGATIGDFWVFYRRVGLGFIAVAFLFGVSLALLIPHTEPTAAGVNNAVMGQAMAFIPLLLLLWIAPLWVYLNVMISNLIWSKTSIKGISFRSELKFWPMFVLYISNILGIIFSFGLLIPWAKIRITRYRLSCMGLCCTEEELKGFVAGQVEIVGAFGEELSDILDVDIGL